MNRDFIAPYTPRRRPAPRPVRRRAATLLAVSAMVIGGLPCGVACGSPMNPAVASEPFATPSSWRQAISPNPLIDPNSAAMIAAVQSQPVLSANLIEFGVPIYTVAADTPTYKVNCTQAGWGVCQLNGWAIGIPDGATPNTGSDHVMVTIDDRRGLIFEFWQAVKSGDQWSTSWGGVNDLHGSGWGGAATGSGASRLAGVIRLSEVAAGDIPHALALQTNNACTAFRPPALTSDGKSTRSDCIPEGARLQLDPTLDLTKLNLAAGERAVATAMQRYGGYVMDVGGAPLSVSFELDTKASAGTLGDTYNAAGFRWDYDAMERVPWEKLRVLQ